MSCTGLLCVESSQNFSSYVLTNVSTLQLYYLYGATITYCTCVVLSLWNFQFESQNSKLYLCSTVSVQQIKVRLI